MTEAMQNRCISRTAFRQLTKFKNWTSTISQLLNPDTGVAQAKVDKVPPPQHTLFQNKRKID